MNTSEQKVSSVEINCKCEAQAKTAILNFLDKLGIKKIVYVDDRCSINELKEAFVGKLKAHYNNKPCELDFLEKSEYAVTANELKNQSDIPIQLFLFCIGYQ